MIPKLHDRGDLADRQLAAQLAQAGLSRVASEHKAERLASAAAALADGDRGDDVGRLRAFFVPGRIEVLGKHTDYAGGRSLIVAAERGFCLVASARDDKAITLVDAASAETAAFELGPELTPTVGHWSNYPMTVARRIARNFPEARRGADVAFASDLPPAAGMSSSSV
ncbi:MAG: galactokinase family protein, partial [Planctomycetota bacterium]